MKAKLKTMMEYLQRYSESLELDDEIESYNQSQLEI